MNEAHARDIATDLLLWLCTNEELLGVFLGATGASADDLRMALHSGAQDPALAIAALDFTLMRDDTVLQAAAALGLPPERLAMAAAVLAGPGGTHWT